MGETEGGTPDSLETAVISPPSGTAQLVSAHGKDSQGVINQTTANQLTSRREEARRKVFFASRFFVLRQNALYGARTANRQREKGALKRRPRGIFYEKRICSGRLAEF